MERIQIDQHTVLEIPDAVVAASVGRDLVADYAAASPADREHILSLAIEATTVQPARATPATTPAPVSPSPVASTETTAAASLEQ
jgi:hypothetical protein